MSYSLVYTDHFNDCVREYQQRDARYLAELMQVVMDLARQPFNNPSLQTHAMKGVTGEKRFISYVGGSKGRRLVWSRFNRAIVLLLYGEHDVVERKAERLVIEYDGPDEGLTIREVAETTSSVSIAEPGSTAEPGQLFMAYTDGELREFGFGEHEVPVLRALNTQDELIALDMADESFELAFNLLAYQDPDGPAKEHATDAGRQAIEETVQQLRPEEVERERHIEEPAARPHFLPLSEERLKELLAAPVEDWMVFLHPDQAGLVEQTFSGPARVRGAAGTGKTVVGLHRARHLADTYDAPVLFTTYIRNLPPVFESIFRRLDRDGGTKVEFANLHKVAHHLASKAGIEFQLNPDATDAAFVSAHRAVVKPGTQLDQLGFTRGYLREEIDWVIKGRGLVELASYLDLPRSGRGTPLHAEARKQAWALYEAYQHELSRRQIIDFNDLLNRAIEALILGRATSPYRAVIVDEAQDLTEMGLRLAHLLAGGNQEDGLFLLGDGQQSIYPGGFNLANIGIDIRGRSTLLRVNYRNPRRVAELAASIVTGSTYDDLDDQPQPGERDVKIEREGGEPELCAFEDADEHDAALVARIDDLVDRQDTGPGDIAVLVPTNAMVKHYSGLISDLGYGTQKLASYDGTPNDLVKVGTFKRGKGLEFKRVLIPRLDADGINERPRRGEDENSHAERLELIRRQVFVAVTRARDGVWIGWIDQPANLFAGLTDASS